MISTDEIKLHIKNLRDFATQRIFPFDSNTLSPDLRQILANIQSQLNVEKLSLKEIRAIFKDAYEAAKKFENNLKSIDDGAFIAVLYEAVVYGRQQLLEIHNKKNFSNLATSYTALSKEIQWEISQFNTTKDLNGFEEVVTKENYLSDIEYFDDNNKKKFLYDFFGLLKDNKNSILLSQLAMKIAVKNFKESDLLVLFDQEPGYLNAMLKLPPTLFCNFISEKLYDKVKLINKNLLPAVEHFSHLAQISLWPSEIRDLLTILAPKYLQIFIKEYKEFDFLLVCPQLYPIFSVKFWVKSGLGIQTMDYELKENGKVAFLSSQEDRSSSLLHSDIKSAFAYVARIAHFLNHIDQIKIILIKDGSLLKDQKDVFEKKNINVSGKNFLLITKEIIDNFEVQVEEDVADEPNSDSDASASMSDQDDADDDLSEEESSSPPPP